MSGSGKPNVLVLRSPGTNCDAESAYAFELAGAETTSVHVNQLLEKPSMLSDYQILCLPGGFSYGDDIAAGKILALQLKTLGNLIGEFHEQGKLVLGICNGFQVLIKSGFLLPEVSDGYPATLTWNDSGRFIDRWVHLAADDGKCVFLKGIKRMYLPIAHAEGKFVPQTAAILSELESKHQLAIKYCKSTGPNGAVPYPANPNGSTADVAGVCNDTGRIFGLMPHPERHIDPTHHPQWTRMAGTENGLPEKGDGMAIFENAVGFFS